MKFCPSLIKFAFLFNIMFYIFSRYSAVRRQGELVDGVEPRVLDYTSQQAKVGYFFIFARISEDMSETTSHLIRYVGNATCPGSSSSCSCRWSSLGGGRSLGDVQHSAGEQGLFLGRVSKIIN